MGMHHQAHFMYLCGTEDRTYGVMNVRQEFYYLGYNPSPNDV